jgi:hypothetical protein
MFGVVGTKFNFELLGGLYQECPGPPNTERRLERRHGGCVCQRHGVSLHACFLKIRVSIHDLIRAVGHIHNLCVFVVGICSVVVVVGQLVSLQGARRSTVPTHLAQSTQTMRQVTRTTNNQLLSYQAGLGSRGEM